jgi:hypothetical protein
MCSMIPCRILTHRCRVNQNAQIAGLVYSFHFARSACRSMPAGVLIFTQSDVRPRRYGGSARFAMMPSMP